METKTNTGKTFEGVVVKSAMKDTVTVLVSRYVKHPKYKKYQKKTKKYLVHNPGNTAAVDENAVVLVEKDKKEPKANRVFGPIPREVVERGYQKIGSMAPEVV